MATRNWRSVDDLSISELRFILLEKHKGVHDQRLAHYQKTGKVTPLIQAHQAGVNVDGAQKAESVSASSIRRVERRGSRAKRMDTMLLMIEAIAVMGLVGVLVAGFFTLRNLNREVTAALQQPTISPTPLIVAVVLPGGHTPPNSEGGVRPNDAEIPEHLLPIVQSLANIPIPTASPEQAIRIQIPAIDVDAPVVQGDGWEQMRKGVGQHINNVLPGQIGNVVLSAHNDIFGEIFRDLDKLKPGDKVILFTTSRQYTYLVGNSLVVEPTRVDVMEATASPSLTLISCYPYMVDNKRIVIQATLQN